MAAVFRKRATGGGYVCEDPHKAATIVPNDKKYIVYDVIDLGYHGAIDNTSEDDRNIKYYDTEGDFSGWGLIRSQVYEVEQSGPFITVE